MKLYILLAFIVVSIKTESFDVGNDDGVVIGEDTDHADEIPVEGTEWIQTAVATVGYYLRAHKFNDFDRRYHTEPPTDPSYVPLFDAFPTPPLKYFHWDVFQHCNSNFTRCLRYLYETAVDAYYQRLVDTSYVMYQKNWTLPGNKSLVTPVNEECEHLKKLDWTRAEPFRGPLERFQWRTTASYYMCYYTNKHEEFLEKFGEPCDNFANCLDGNEGRNGDHRANDDVPHACASYSFCPDPCCQGVKLAKTFNPDCWYNNPCYKDTKNSPRRKNETYYCFSNSNVSLTALIYNEWDIACIWVCEEGYEYDAKYQRCVDINECLPLNPVDDNCSENELCLNTPGNSSCACEFSTRWNAGTKRCETNDVVVEALKRFAKTDRKDEITPKSQFWIYAIYFVIFAACLIAAFAIAWYFNQHG